MLSNDPTRTATERIDALNVVTANGGRQLSSAENWLPADAAGLRAAQLEQFRHDERYHREIARLTVKERFTHMALHFAKYSGYFVEGRTDSELRRLIIDVFVIGVSCANSLNIRIYDHLVDRPAPAGDVDAFGRTLAIAAGRMASACERLDHLETFAYRQTIQDAILEIVGAAISVARHESWDILTETRGRLLRVKEKSIFHGDL